MNYSQLRIEKSNSLYFLSKKDLYICIQPSFHTLYNDHKSLVNLFSEHNAVPSQASCRIQCCVLALSMCEYTLCSLLTPEHKNAEAMSMHTSPTYCSRGNFRSS